MANPTNSKESATPAPAPAAVPSTVEAQLAATLAALAQSQAQMAEMIQQQNDFNRRALKIAPKRRKTMHEYLREKPRKHLPHEVWQNGNPVNPAGLSQETIAILDTLDSGVYCDGLVEVRRVRAGIDGIDSKIYLRYNNKAIEQRILLYSKFPTLTSMIRRIADDMKAMGIAPVHETGRAPLELEVPADEDF